MWQLPSDIAPEEILMYLRKSRSDDQSQTVEETLEKHEKILDEWVERHFPGRRIPDRNRFREVGSAESIESRPEYQRLLRTIEDARYRAVLVIDEARLSRGDLEEIGYTIKIFRYSNTYIFTERDMYDLSEERDREFFEKKLQQSSSYLEYYKMIQKRGTEASVAAGNYIGNIPPYGTIKVSFKENGRSVHTLEPNPEKIKVVDMIHEWCDNGISEHGIANKLNALGIPAPNGGKWTAPTVHSILTNPHYIGLVRWNYRKTVRTVQDGEVVVTRPRNKDCLLIPGRHAPMIDVPRFWRNQERLKKNPPVKKSADIVNPFAGLVYCQCGSCMTKRTYKKGPQKIERSAPRLLCINQTECNTASCTVDEMTEIVANALTSAIADFDVKINQTETGEADFRRQQLTRLEKRMDELDRQELSQWEKYAQDSMPKHIFDTLNRKVLNEKAEVKDAIEKLKTEGSKKEYYIKKRETFHEALTCLQNENATGKEKNRLLKQCIIRIEYTRKKKSGNRRYGDPHPIEANIQLNV